MRYFPANRAAFPRPCSLDEVLPGEQGRGNAALLDQAAQALRVDTQLARGFNQI
jgi:hypothetical protein